MSQQPIQIDVRTPQTVVVDVSNKLAKTSTADIIEALEPIFTFDNPKEGDILLHDGSTFKNRPKQELTDGGNF